MKKTVRDIDVAGKKCLVRCDFNVPMKDGKITEQLAAQSLVRDAREDYTKQLLDAVFSVRELQQNEKAWS